MASNVNDIAHDAPAFRSPLGVVLSKAVFTAMSFFFSSFVFSISQATQPLLLVLAPTMHKKCVAELILADRARLIASAFVL